MAHPTEMEEKLRLASIPQPLPEVLLEHIYRGTTVVVGLTRLGCHRGGVMLTCGVSKVLLQGVGA